MRSYSAFRLFFLPVLCAGISVGGLVACSENPHPVVLDVSLETATDISSEAFAPPKAPPPSEVTRATREEADNGTAVVSPEVLKEEQRARQAAVAAAWQQRLGVFLEGAAAAQQQQQQQQQAAERNDSVSHRSTAEKGLKIASLTFASIAFALFLFCFIVEIQNRLPSAYSVLPPSLPPQSVPDVVMKLVSDNKLVVFLADDCPICVSGLKELEATGQDPVVVLLMGHRLERQVRGFLERQFGVGRLPSIFFEGSPLGDFASAITYLGSPAAGGEAKKSEGD